MIQNDNVFFESATDVEWNLPMILVLGQVNVHPERNGWLIEIYDDQHKKDFKVLSSPFSRPGGPSTDNEHLPE